MNIFENIFSFEYYWMQYIYVFKFKMYIKRSIRIAGQKATKVHYVGKQELKKDGLFMYSFDRFPYELFLTNSIYEK